MVLLRALWISQKNAWSTYHRKSDDMKRAVLYARISRGSWQKRGRMLLEQIQTCRQFAISEGWHIVAELAENDRRNPGYSRNLPKLEIMMDMAVAGDFDVLIAADMDRLSRSLAKQILIENELIRFGIDIAYVNNIYPKTSDGQLVKQIRAVISEYEQVKSVERLCRGLRSSVKAGNVMISDQPPYGYMKKKKDGRRNLAVLEEDALVVRLIYKWYTEGDSDGKLLGSTSIARKLSQLLIPTPCFYRRKLSKKNNDSFQWSVTTILRILKTETYAGIWQYGKEIKEKSRVTVWNTNSPLPSVKVPAIISREVWKAAQAQNNMNKTNIFRKRSYLLADRVNCYHCKKTPSIAPVRSSTGAIYKYYNCVSKYRNHGNCTNKGLFQLQPIDNSVFDWLLKQLGDSELERIKMKLCHKVFHLLDWEINVFSELIEKKREKRGRLSKITKFSYYPDDYINQHDRNLVQNISALEQERACLRSKLRLLKSFKLKQLNSAYPNYETPEELAFDFRIKRELIKYLDISGALASIDGMKIAHITSKVGEITFRLRGRERKPGFPVIRPIELSSVSLRMSSSGNFKKME